MLFETDILVARARRSLPAGVYQDEVTLLKVRDDAVLAIEDGHPAGFGYLLFRGRWYTPDAYDPDTWTSDDGLVLADPGLAAAASEAIGRLDSP